MNETVKESKELAVEFAVDNCKILLTPSIVQKYIVGTDSKITVQEFKFFTELCKARQLNPFLKEAYCIKYGNEPAQIVVAKEVFIKRAILHPQYDGKETGVIVLDKEGKIIERPGCLVLPGEELVGGWARVYRKDRTYPEYMSVAFDEVAGRKKDGRLNTNWDKKGATMVEKVAKVRALREAFADELGGMNVEGEPIDAEVINTTGTDLDERQNDIKALGKSKGKVTLDEI
ncbi:MAG: phage recombination protein Bet [Christensenellales bacterium]|jgi:phage recombination protein Bet